MGRRSRPERSEGHADHVAQKRSVSVTIAWSYGVVWFGGMFCAHPVVVDDLGDDRELPGGRTIVDQDDASDLDEALEGGGGLYLRGGERTSVNAYQ